MAKDDREKAFRPDAPHGVITTDTIENVLPNSMLPYAEFVILDRALPRVEDGLKPVQRRILYTMNEMGLTPDKPHKKSARIVGDCMGKYHPHGDSSVYDAMVRMAQDFNMRMTLVDGHGNFGSVDGDPAAAMRYTEARLQPLALELLRDIDRETVPFSFNFDDTLLEPDILPGRYPNLLVNGANGIAVGLATNIPTHNLTEVIDGACAYIDNPDISLEEMMKIVPGPDFPTGGNIIKNELEQAYRTGKGRITVRAEYSVEMGEKGTKEIIITELPYQTNKAELLRKIMLLKEDKKDVLSGIAEIVDESDRQGMRAVIYCRKDANVDSILNCLFKYTDLETTFGINMVAIAGGKPQQLGLLDIFRYYTGYQRQVVLRRSRFELREAEARCHILEGLIIGVHNIDEVVRIIKNAESTADAKRQLMETFSLSDRQAQAILDLRLARLAKLEIQKLEDELAELRKKIEELRRIIDSKAAQYDIVKKELREIRKKYRCERKSRIYDSAEAIPTVRRDIRKPATDWAVCLTAAGNIKFMEKTELEQKIKRPILSTAKPDTIINDASIVFSTGVSLVFTNLGNVVKIDLEYREDEDYRAPGKKLKDFSPEVQDGERIVKIISYKDALPDGDILFFTKQGNVKRTAWAEYDVGRTYFPGIKLKTDDEVINVEPYDRDEFSDMAFITRKGNCLNAMKNDVPVQGRIAGGVRGILLNDGDEVIFATQHTGEGEFVVGMASGLYKRVIVSTIDELPRARKGILIADMKNRDNTKDEVTFADYVTVPYMLAFFGTDRSVTEISTESVPIAPRFSKGRALKYAPASVERVVSVRPKPGIPGAKRI